MTIIWLCNSYTQYFCEFHFCLTNPSTTRFNMENKMGSTNHIINDTHAKLIFTKHHANDTNIILAKFLSLFRLKSQLLSSFKVIVGKKYSR